MATKPKRNKADSPSRTKSGGGGGSKEEPKQEKEPKKALPHRAEREGTRRIHDRHLTGTESKRRQEREASRRKDEVAAQAKRRDERQPKGWAGRRAARGR